jgi:glycosyltransferase involved in cell wall biosynthesis
MKVGIVLYSPNLFGGGNKLASELISSLAQNGFSVAVCSFHRPIRGRAYPEFFEIEDWYATAEHALLKLNIGKLYRIAFNQYFTLKKLVKKFKPDVIIGADTEPAIMLGQKAKKVMYVHFPTECKTYRHSLRHELYRSLYWWRHYQALRELDAIVSNSEYTKEITYTLWKTSQPEKSRYHVIYPCVDTRKFRRELERQPKVCYVGRIDPKKGIEYVIEAFLKVREELKDIKLEIVGGVKGSPWAEKYYPVLTSKIRNLDGISLKVDVPEQETVNTLLTSRCMASFNLEEHFGIVPVEAMASGCPPICADGGGQRETVINGKTGFLVRNIEELAERMRLLLTDDHLFRNMSRQAREHAKQFDKSVFTRKWIQLLEALC